MAWHNVQKAAYALSRLTAVPGVRKKFAGPSFNEFVLELPKPWAAVDGALRAKKILGGLGLADFGPGLERCVLVCVTEQHAREDIDKLARSFEEVLR